MKAVLAAEIGEQIVVTLTMTKSELAQAAADPQILADAVCGVCGTPAPSAQEEEQSAGCTEKKEVPPSEGSPFRYRDVVPDGLSGTKEAVVESVVKLLIDQNEIPVDMAAVESEADFSFRAVMQRIKYDVMFGGAPASEAEVDPEELMAEIREDLILEQKENYIFKMIIELEGIEASPEELLAEAEAMAHRQDTTVEMIRSFFGEDLSGLAGEVRKRKAKDFLYSLATGETL